MKVLLFVALFVAVYCAKKQTPEEVQATSEECIKSTGVDPKLLENLNMKGEFSEDPKLKCYIKCMAVETGGMTETGDLLVDDIKSVMVDGGLPADQINQMIDPCKDLKGKDPCDTAFAVAKCMVDKAINNVSANVTKN